MTRGLEIQIAHAIALPAPAHRAAAEHALSTPVKGLRLCVRILAIVHEPVVVVLAACIAQALNGPLLSDLGRESEIWQLPRWFVLGEILGRDLFPRLEHHYAHS